MLPSPRSRGAAPRDFVLLLKPRVAALVAFTGLVGMLLAGHMPHPVLAATAILCIAVGAGAAGAINMWYEADLDARMERTRDRPLPAGRMEAGTALGFGAVLAVASVAVLGLATNWLAAALLALAILFYVFVYTMWLKRRTPHNIVVGGAAGAIPPIIGWAAATGDLHPPADPALRDHLHVDAAAFLGAVAVPVGRLPARARADAARHRRSREHAPAHLLGYALVLAPLSLAPVAAGYAHAVYGLGAAVLGTAFVALAAILWRRRGEAPARRLFAFSIAYLFLIFLLLTIDNAWRVGLG